MASKPNYQPTKMRPLVQMIARIVQKNPSIADNPGFLMATLAHNIPDFNNEAKCLNCGASMAEYIYTFTILDALLLFGMAKQVSKNLEKTRGEFTEANKVHLPSLKGVNHTSMIRQGYTGKLGLIAKHMGANGRQERGMWVITRRGWAALRGEPVPKAVRVFRGKILERPDELITMTEVFRAYGDSVQRIVQAGKLPKIDNRKEMDGYTPMEWVQMAGMHQGKLI